MYIVTFFDKNEYRRRPDFYSYDPYNTGDVNEYVVDVYPTRKAAEARAREMNQGQVSTYDATVWPSHRVVAQ